MQYIAKQAVAPTDWEDWFNTATNRRSYGYKADYSELRNITDARAFLLGEQHELCAYCQSALTVEQASIEHVIPKEHNVPFSTHYHNLVAVCKSTSLDNTGKRYCEEMRGSELLPPIIFYANAQVTETKNHTFFTAYRDGAIDVKPKLQDVISNQVKSFIDILNLNHSILSKKRKEALDGILSVYDLLPNLQKRNYLQVQFNRVLSNPNTPYRQYLLIYLGQKLGLN